MPAPKSDKRKEAKKAIRAGKTHMKFHIVLPKDVDVAKFTDKLIDLVEAFEGTVGGGVVKGE